MIGRRTWARALGGAALLLALALPAAAVEGRLVMSGDDDLESAVEAGSLVLAATREDRPTVQDVIAAARADYANIIGILYRQGHYGPVVSILIDGREAADLSPFTLPPSVGTVTLRVDPGPAFRFGRAEIGPLAPETELPDGFRPGEPARSETVRDAVGDAVEGWRQVGHAKARPGARRIVANHPARVLDATIAILPGQRLTFGRMSVEGNRAVRTDRIREIAGFPGGHVFDPDELDTVARRLRRTGAFKSVALEEAETPNPDGSLDIGLSVVEEAPRRFGIGGEISSTEGLKVSGYWMHRNLLGGAERLRFDAEIAGLGGETGGIDYTLTTAFSRPGTFSANNTLNIGLELSQLDEPDFFSRQARFDVGLAREISERIEYSFGVGYLYAQVEDDLGERDFSLIVLPLTARFDSRDAPLNPKGGTYLRLEATPFTGFAGSETGARFYGDARTYFSFGAEDRFTLAGRLQLGSVAGASLAGTPPDMLFYSGGGGTVRGQPYQSLNVPLGGGDFIGGQNLIAASAEARVRVGRKFQIVGFYDWGFVGEGAVPGQDGASHAGAGLGLRYDTALGPIRLDVAAPVSGDTGHGVQVYVGIGQAF